MLFAVLLLAGAVDREDRVVSGDAERLRIGNGVVHIQGTGGHFVPEEPGSKLFKAPVCGGMCGYKGKGAGEAAEETDT